MASLSCKVYISDVEAVKFKKTECLKEYTQVKENFFLLIYWPLQLCSHTGLCSLLNVIVNTIFDYPKIVWLNSCSKPNLIHSFDDVNIDNSNFSIKSLCWNNQMPNIHSQEEVKP